MVNLRKGQVRDYLKPTIHGVGFVGDKYQATIKGKATPQYTIWSGMIARCYDTNCHVKHPTYKDCIASENFKSYEYFYNWCNEQIGFNGRFHLDKDLLIKGNKVYSEDTCVFLPREINNILLKSSGSRGLHPIGVRRHDGCKAFVARVNVNGKLKHLGVFNTELEAFNAYKTAKEFHLKELAEKYKTQIDPRAYNALMNYKVEITD